MKNKSIFIMFFFFIFGMLTSFGVMYFFSDVYYEFKNKNRDVVVIDDGISKGINNVYDAVVSIENYKGGKLSGNGSGFIYDKDGYIITNQHVISNNSEIKVILSDKSVIDAKLIGSDEFADVAILKIDKQYVKGVAKIGSSKSANLGDTVFTVGSPMSSDYFGTITKGIISGKNRMVEVPVRSSSNDWIMDVLQTDAAINPGNSGGPLCNVNGEVIGVNTMKISEDDIEGVGFSIPIEDVMIYVNKIVNNENIDRTYMGITMIDATSSRFLLRQYDINISDSIDSGVIVVEIDEDGPSYKAGIKKGDVIIKIDDHVIKNSAHLKYYLYKYKPNDNVKIYLLRNNEEKIVSLTLEKGE